MKDANEYFRKTSKKRKYYQMVYEKIYIYSPHPSELPLPSANLFINKKIINKIKIILFGKVLRIFFSF